MKKSRNDRRKIRRWFMHEFNSDKSFIVYFKQEGPVTAARQRGKNRQIARYRYGLKSKRHASRFVEVSL